MITFWTILAGVGTFVAGQIILKLVIDPVQSLKMIIAEIANKLILYANIYADPRPKGDKDQEVILQDFRMLSSTLQSSMYLIPGYNFVHYLFGLPSKENVVRASTELIVLHNGYDGALANQGFLNCYSAQKIRVSLNIFIPEGERLNSEREQHFIKAKDN